MMNTQESLEGLDIEGLENKLWRKSHSYKTIQAFHNAVKSFKSFIEEKGIKLTEDPYKILDSFAGWLDSQGYRALTVRCYISFIKRLFNNSGISVNTDQMREKVTLPKKTPFQDSSLEPETAKRIILACKNATLKLILLLMKDTITRPSELLGLTLGDFNLSSEPPSLTIPSYLAKNDIPREVFFTPETKIVLMDYLENKGIRKPSQFLFIRENVDPITDEKGFQKAIEKTLNTIEVAWLYLMNKPAFQNLKEQVRQRSKTIRYKLHIYSFKKFGFTKIADTLGSLAAHAIAGHQEYLITYYKKSREERAKDYLKVIPKLRLFTPSEEEKLREEVAETIKELPKEALLEILKIGKKCLRG